MSAWTPILECARAAAAKDAVAAIASKLAMRDPATETDASLASGASGYATLFGYLHRAGLGPVGASDLARTWLCRAADLASSEVLPPSLFGGYAGVAWTMTHLLPHLYGMDAEDPAEDVDQALLDVLGESPWSGDYDLIDGLVGLGVYALERVPRPAARICLERCIDRLAELAVRSVTGVTWNTPARLLPPWKSEAFPGGYFDVGVAHGVPGVIAFLGSAHTSGVRPTATPDLLDGAVAWTLSQRLAGGPGSSLPAMVPPGRTPLVARTAWCYGDLGVATALLVAARAVGEVSWEREAVEMARGAARRALDETGVTDAGLCHGTSGLGHLFNRMYQVTGDGDLRDAARAWISRTLALRREGEGGAGFRSLLPNDTGGVSWEDDPSFLTGAAGIALVLLAAISDVEPEWDRLLLVSAGTCG